MRLIIEYYKNNKRSIYCFNIKKDLVSIINSYKDLSVFVDSVSRANGIIFEFKIEFTINHVVKNMIVYNELKKLTNLYDYLEIINFCLKNTHDYTYNFKFGEVGGDRYRYCFNDIFLNAFQKILLNKHSLYNKNNKEITIYIPFKN